ncbi:PAAR domain-containing protein [Photorhabdus sp. RM323S]|uniref:PAAR domain-containing protein n=1 Tax=Photorhabdus sp. RM323S TaxID=3342828 RepID=UPI0036DB5C9C
MTNRAVIRLNDTTDHGGKIITAIDDWIYQSVPIAAKGYLVNCPMCKGVFPIVEGSDDLKHQGKMSGHDSMINPVRRQNLVCETLNNIPKSHWHFLEPISYEYVLIALSIFPNITVFNTEL